MNFSKPFVLSNNNNNNKNNRRSTSNSGPSSSTPITGSPAFSLSPTISTIRTRSRGPEDDSDLENIPEDVGLSRDSDDASPSRGVKRRRIQSSSIKWIGAIRSLKPKNKDSLYHKLMSQPAHYEDIVKDLISLYQRDQETAVILLLQLLTDLTGCQEVNMRNIYKFDESEDVRSILKAVSILEQTVMAKSVKNAHVFLFMKTVGASRVAESLLSKFIMELILASFKEEMLFDETFSVHIFGFIECMAFSKVNNIRTTGVILSIKVLTALLELFVKLIDFMKNNNDEGTVNEANKRKERLETYIDFFSTIFQKNCSYLDPKCVVIKVKCAEELVNWVKHFPEMFLIKFRCIGHLLRLVREPNDIVRLTALQIFEQLFSLSELYESMNKRIEVTLKIISERILDVNYKIATKAIEIFTKAISQYSEYIIKDYKMLIIKQIFQKNEGLAKAAAIFLMEFFHAYKSDTKWILQSLVKVTFHKDEFCSRIAIFLETIDPYAPELEHFDTMFAVLLDTNIHIEMRKCLLNVASEKIRQFLTGKFSYQRDPHLKRDVETSNHNKIAQIILPNLKDLLYEFIDHKRSCGHLMEILSFINFQYCSQTLLLNYSEMFEFLEEIFRVNCNVDLLQSICTIFYNLCNTENALKELADRLVKNMTKTCCVPLVKDLKEVASNNNTEFLQKMRENSLKASIIFSKFNLTDILKWRLISLEWNTIPNFKAWKYVLVCCKFNLIWRLDEYIKNDVGNNGEVEPLLYNDCKEFIYKSLLLITLNNNSAALLTFENLYDFYAKFELKLKRHREHQNLMIKIEDTKLQDVLMEFVNKYVFDSKNLSLPVREQYLANIVDLINLEVVSVNYFANILRYYQKYNEEFGNIFNSIITTLKSTHSSALVCVIMHTLAQEFMKILKKYNFVDFKYEESLHLKALAKKLSKEGIYSNSDTLKLVLSYINFAFRSEQHLQFLFLAQYFVPLLNEENKAEAYDLFQKKLDSSVDRNADVISLFGAGLKPKKK